MGQDYAYILAAQIGYLSPERNLNFINRGDGGDRLPDLAARWQTDATTVPCSRRGRQNATLLADDAPSSSVRTAGICTGNSGRILAGT